MEYRISAYWANLLFLLGYFFLSLGQFPQGVILDESQIRLIEKGQRSNFSQQEFATIKQYLSWHLSFPTIGLLPSKIQLCYPFIPHYFSLWELAPHRGASAKIALIDGGLVSEQQRKQYLFSLFESINLLSTSKSDFSSDECQFMQGHGTYSAGILGANPVLQNLLPSPVVGIAPASSLLMIKAFDGCGITSEKILIDALDVALKNHAQVVSLSFKFDRLSNPDDNHRLESLLKQAPYLVAAAGNDQKKRGVVGEAYPASELEVAFDVGAFGFNGTDAFLLDFSQFQEGVGPLFVAPGQNILSTWISDSPQNSRYLFFSGTSVATTIMTGIISLIVGEFGSEMSRREIVAVCYASSLKFHNSFDWNQKVVLGALDARMALFMLHVMRTLRTNKKISLNGILFDSLIMAIRKILLNQVNEYGTHYFAEPIDFAVSFIDYWKMAQEKEGAWNRYKKDHSIPQTVDGAVQSIVDIIEQAISETQEQEDESLLISEIRTILRSSSSPLLEWLPKGARKRLEVVKLK